MIAHTQADPAATHIGLIKASPVQFIISLPNVNYLPPANANL